MSKIVKLFFIFFVPAVLLITSCSNSPALVEIEVPLKNKINESVEKDTVFIEKPIILPIPSLASVITGLDVLRNMEFSPLSGLNVGLITNQTGIDTSFQSTIDILYSASEVNLIALYSPEHGIRGTEDAGEILKDYTDSKTGLPVYSLHGENRQPSEVMLKNIDIIVYDIQDIGCRSYTYISTMGLAMEACARSNIKFIVLDRPNPIGGNRVEGTLVDSNYTSFVSQYPIPYVYGLTPGELATLLNEELLIDQNIKVDLEVIPMENWERNMIFNDTGLPWVQTSPHIPTMESPFFYIMTGVLGELGVISEGVGYTAPFHYFGAPWVISDSLALKLYDKVPGIKFRPINFKPFYGRFKDQYCGGVEIYIQDLTKVNLLEVQFHIMEALSDLYPDKDLFEMAESDRITMFDKVIGTDRIRVEFSKRQKITDIQSILNEDVEKFKNISKKYYLYD